MEQFRKSLAFDQDSSKKENDLDDGLSDDLKIFGLVLDKRFTHLQVTSIETTQGPTYISDI